MKARKLAIPATLESPDGACRRVIILDLTEQGCTVEDGAEILPSDGSSLWIGAVGPLRIQYPANLPRHYEFDGAINPSIVSHFNS